LAFFAVIPHETAQFHSCRSWPAGVHAAAAPLGCQSDKTKAAFRSFAMSIKMILLPIFVEVALTFALMFMMGRSRVAAVKSGQTKMADVALGQLNWPAKVQQVSNSYASQFQLPVLFYVLTVLAIVTHHADYLFLVLAWLFVVTRLVHAYIHTGSNYVRHRFNAFLIGAIILMAMWIIFAVDILLGLS
jgi:hypothetical protein